jgi:hypothetical protein
MTGPRDAVDQLAWAVTHPVSALAALGTVVAWVLQVPLVGDVIPWLIAQSGTLFAGLSVLSFTIAPEVPSIPADALKPVALGVGAVYVLSRVHKAGKKLLARFNEE